MSTSIPNVGRSEAIGATIAPPTSGMPPEPPLADLSSQLVQLTAVISELTARMPIPDFPQFETGFVSRPQPAPPYSAPSSGTFPMFTYTPTPSVCVSTMAQPRQPSSSGFPHTLSMSAAYSLPPYGFSDGGGAISATTRPPQSAPQPWQYSMPEHRQLDRMSISRPQMVSASSCWGPPRPTGQFGTLPPEQTHHKVKMEPPRFDGTEVNNWIRGVQFYFDHVGTPEAQRLHYVIMLFEPVVADWIWNYISSHEFVTWYEFLDDVRRRFDP